MFNVLMWSLALIVVLMTFLGIDKADVQEVVKQQIKVNSQHDEIAENAVKINKKAIVVISENEELRKQLREALDKASDLHNELVKCKETIPADFVGTGY